MIYKKRPILLLSILLFGLSLVIRFQIHGFPNADMILLKRWYEHLYINGWAGLADENFSNYPPAYLYLLWLSTLLPNWVGATAAIKLIPTLFDILSAFVIFRLAQLRYDYDTSFFYAAGFCILPTIMFNSTGWGQIDSLYTSFLLVCVYLLLKDKHFWAMAAFGMAFSFKAQAIFLLPFLGILFLKGRIRWYHFFLPPAIYLLLGIPAAWIGRSWTSIISIYFGQLGQFHRLSLNAPNLYVFMPEASYDWGMWIGMGVFLIAMTVWGWLNWRAKPSLSYRQIVLMALAALTLVLFVLPKMHDRYYYPVDVFSFAVVIFAPEMWFVPLFYQIISGLSYLVFLVGAPITNVMIAALMNTGITMYILRMQFLSFENE